MSVRVEAPERATFARVSGARAAGFIGIGLGLLAVFVALPPFELRQVWWPAGIGILGLFAAIWATTRGERRLGLLAVAANLFGISLGMLATQSSVENLNLVVVWSALIAATLRYATPLTFAAIGGMFSERSGVVNIGLEGQMLMGAFFAIWGADVTDSWELGLVIAMSPASPGAPARLLLHPSPRRPDRDRHRRQLSRARAHGLPLHRHLRRPGNSDDHSGDP